MKTAIIYMSKHGATSTVATLIAESITDSELKIFNLSENENPETSEFDRILIGGSIHAGMVQKRVKDFCLKNMGILLQKEIGLFLCGMLKEEQEKQYLTSFPEELRKHAKAYALPGGEFSLDKMNFFERAIVKKVSKIDKSISDINNEVIKDFVNKMIG